MNAPGIGNLCLFDLDGTLLPFDSDHAFGEFLITLNWADGRSFRQRNDAFFADYQRGQLDLAQYVEFATGPWRARPLAEALVARDRFMHEIVSPRLHRTALELVRHHQAQGDLTALVTATNEFVTGPIAQAFGIEHLIAVELERLPDGAYGPRVRGVASYREGKVVRVNTWLAGLGCSLAQFGRISVYSDSTNDLPLLELATDPVATNPSDALAAIARQRNWRILKLFST